MKIHVDAHVIVNHVEGGGNDEVLAAIADLREILDGTAVLAALLDEANADRAAAIAGLAAIFAPNESV